MAEIIASRPAGSSRAPLIGNTCMVMLRMDTARPSGCVLPITDTLCLFIDNEARKCSSTKPLRTESSLWYRASTISMLIDYELTCCKLTNQLWQYRPKPVCGVQQAFCFGVASVSARLISEHKYFANASASRTVSFLEEFPWGVWWGNYMAKSKFLAAAWKTVSRVSIRPRNHSSAAMVTNNWANLSWMEEQDSQFRLQPQSRQRAKIVRLEENIHRWMRPTQHGFELVG